VAFKIDYLFWKIAHFLIEKKGYRVINISPTQKELWFENFSIKEAPIIRLVRKDLDWGNWVRRDIELTSLNGEKIRKTFKKKTVNVQNIYVSTYPPVDEYGDLLPSNFAFPTGEKTTVHSMLIDEKDGRDNLKATHLFQEEDWMIPDELDETHVEWMKQLALSSNVKKVEKEKQLFQRGKPFFTYLLIAVQVIMFFIVEFNGGSQNPETLIEYGAKYNPLILEGEWWRFFTPIFLHIGLLHLLMNTLALFYLGTAVERIFGRLRFVLVYVVSGFFGSLASFVFTTNLSAGASGAIFGCFGALIYFGVLYPKVFFRTMGTNIIVVILLNLVFGFSMPGIDNAGHLGGLLGGFLAAGFVSVPKRFHPIRQTIILLVTIVVGFFLWQAGFNNESSKWDVSTANGVAQIKIKDENWSEARELLNQVVTGGNANAQSYFLLSYAEIQQGDIASAKDHLQKSLDLQSSFHEAHYNLALILIDEGNKREALIHAKKAYELMPKENKYKTLYNELNN
jgi:rhomboid protease GluP